MKRVAGFVFAIGIMVVGHGEGLAEQRAPRFGLDSVSTYVLTAWDMEPSISTIQYGLLFDYGRYTTNGGALLAGVQVPQGALLVGFELDGCDTSTSGEMTAYLTRVFETSGLTLASVGTGGPAAPGCERFVVDVANPETVDNVENRYIVNVQNSTSDGSTSVRAIRVYYQLQVSPSPATPSFNDVPESDLAFQFIEAMAASGITAGCGGGNYCPDAPLTRR